MLREHANICEKSTGLSDEGFLIPIILYSLTLHIFTVCPIQSEEYDIMNLLFIDPIFKRVNCFCKAKQKCLKKSDNKTFQSSAKCQFQVNKKA